MDLQTIVPYVSVLCNAFLDNVFKLVLRFFGSSVATYKSSSALRLCSFSFPLFFLSALSVTIHKKITLWQGFHPFHLSLSRRQVHSIVHIH